MTAVAAGLIGDHAVTVTLPLARVGMSFAHGNADHGPAAHLFTAVSTSVTLILLAVSLAGYLWLAARERRRRRWSASHTIFYALGTVLLGLALSRSFDAWADEDFAAHMAQHLLLTMVAPLGLVLGAPITLLFKSLPQRHARWLGRLLHTRPVHVLANPVTALALNSGGLVVLYFTPLYEVSTRSEVVHIGVHLHFVLSGALFAWVIAGPDPAPRRPSVRVRLVTLGAAVAIHASVGQLIYAGLFVQVHETAAELQAAGSLMYFAGDIAELLLAVALLVTWRPRPVPRLAGPSLVLCQAAGHWAVRARSPRSM